MLQTRRQLLATLLPVLIALGSFAISAFGAYHNNDREFSNRITAIEPSRRMIDRH